MMAAGLASVLLAAAGSAAKADDEATAGALTYFAAGMLMVDAGASVANGWALAAGRPNRLNGYFGVVVGVISLGMVGADLVLTDDPELRDEFAIVMGAAGTASLVLGILNVRRSSPTSDSTNPQSGLLILPALVRTEAQGAGIGLVARLTF